jgi:hypothetical protein
VCVVGYLFDLLANELVTKLMSLQHTVRTSTYETYVNVKDEAIPVTGHGGL